MPVKFAAGFLTIGAGLTLGREGPTVAPDAPFDGERLGDLKLPAGCVFVTIERADELLAVSPEIEAGNRFNAIISPEAAHAAVTLREGAGGGH